MAPQIQPVPRGRQFETHVNVGDVLHEIDAGGTHTVYVHEAGALCPLSAAASPFCRHAEPEQASAGYHGVVQSRRREHVNRKSEITVRLDDDVFREAMNDSTLPLGTKVIVTVVE